MLKGNGSSAVHLCSIKASVHPLEWLTKVYKFNRATQDDPRPALAVKKNIQCTAPTPWQLSTLTHLPTPDLQTQTHLHTHTSQTLQVMVPPLISVFRSYMLSPPKDAYPFVASISIFCSKQSCFVGSLRRRWLLHIELRHYFSHYFDK